MVGLLMGTKLYGGQDDAVGITTRYGWTVRGSNSHCAWTLFGPFQFPVQRVPSLFSGGKAAGAWQ